MMAGFGNSTREILSFREKVWMAFFGEGSEKDRYWGSKRKCNK